MFTDILKLYWKESIAYKAEFLFSVIIVPLRFLAIVLIWSALYKVNNLNIIGEYTLPGLITYFMISMMSSIIIYDTVAQYFEEEIRTGSFMIYLLKPVSFLKLGFYRKFSNRFFAILVEIVPILLIFLIFYRQYFLSGKLLFFIISITLSFFLSYLIYYLVGMLAFWMTRVRSLMYLFRFMIDFFSGLFVPLDLLPGILIKLSYFLPFKYIIYIPTTIYLGRYSTDLSAGFIESVYFQLLMQLFWICLVYILCRIVWHKSIQRFTGVGA